MKSLLPVSLIVALSYSCVSAAAVPDIAGIPICSVVSKIPEGFRATDDCDRMSPLDSCTFTLQSDGHRIKYYIESGTIKTKIFQLSTKFKGPFGLSRTDTPSSVKLKVKKSTGLSMRLFSDPEIYLQSEEKNCAGNSYTISIYFSIKKKAQEVIVSSLPVI